MNRQADKTSLQKEQDASPHPPKTSESSFSVENSAADASTTGYSTSVSDESRPANGCDESIPNNSARKNSTEEYMETEIFCPGCDEEINGYYPQNFCCPRCKINILRNKDGNVTYYGQQHICPKCGHTFGKMTENKQTPLLNPLKMLFTSALWGG